MIIEHDVVVPPPKVEVSKKQVKLRGVPSYRHSLYYSGYKSSFTCLDGSISNIPYSKINDDYCDCPSDGSDEPGTNACPNANFYCDISTSHHQGN